MSKRGGKQTLKYSVWKSMAREAGVEASRQRPEVAGRTLRPELLRMDVIDAAAMDAYQAWPTPVADYPWEDVQDWKQNDFKGLDLSLWYADELCGLCYASPKDSSLCIKIILLERSAGPANALAGLVMLFMVLTVIQYGKLLECKEIVVQDPAPNAVRNYEFQGFKWIPSSQGNRFFLTLETE